MANQTNSKAKALLDWVDARFPLSKMWRDHLSEYYAPKNFNFWYYFARSRFWCWYQIRKHHGPL